jgi:5'-nucleotidase
MHSDPFRPNRIDYATHLFPFVIALSVAVLAGCSSDPSPSGPGAPDSGMSAIDAGSNIDPSEAGATSDAVPDHGTAGNVAVQILAFNDFHGNLEPPAGSGALVTIPIDDPVVGSVGVDGGVTTNADAGTAQVPAGGASYLAAHVKKLRAGQPNTLVVSAGDIIGASPFISNLFRDEPAILVMNALGLDFDGVGNHEFDRGLAELVRLSVPGCSLGDCDGGASYPGAKFQFLAANVENDQTNMTVFAPYAVKEIAGVKLGVIGLTLEGTPSVTVETAIRGLSFKDEVETVNALVPRLRSEGVSAIIVLVHQGGFQDATGTVDTCRGMTGEILPIAAGLDPAVDVVVSAHTHAFYDCTMNGRLLTSASSFGRVLTKIDLTVDPVAKRVVTKSAKNVVVSRDIAPDPDVESIIATYESRSAPLANRVVGHISADIAKSTAGRASCETPLGDVIADAQLTATKSAGTGSAVLAFMNPGGIRTDLVHTASGAEGNGVVTYGEAFAVQPFSNNLVTVTLTGAQIQTVLEQQFSGGVARILQVSAGFTYMYTWDTAGKAGTIDAASIRLNGLPLDKTASYRVTMNSFLAGGGDGFAVFKEGTERLSGGFDLDALVDYLGANDPIVPPASTRVVGNGCAP